MAPAWIPSNPLWIPSLWLKARRRIRKWTADRQRLVDETAEVVSKTGEFIRHATPMLASVESQPGEISARRKGWIAEWRRLRPKLIKAVDRHPSDDVQRLGHELAEDIEKLLQGFFYMSSTFADVRARTDVSQSVIDRHDHASALADELLQRVRAY
jgi:hypothetical protein